MKAIKSRNVVKGEVLFSLSPVLWSCLQKESVQEGEAEDFFPLGSQKKTQV